MGADNTGQYSSLASLASLILYNLFVMYAVFRINFGFNNIIVFISAISFTIISIWFIYAERSGEFDHGEGAVVAIFGVFLIIPFLIYGVLSSNTTSNFFYPPKHK